MHRAFSPRPADHAGLRRVLLALGAFLLVVLLPGWASAQEGNVLAGRTPTQATGVRCVQCLTDGVAAREGGFWKSTLTARFGRSAIIDFDLGQPVALRGAWIQGDNNDTYAIEASDDGVSFSPLWRASPVRQSGLRERFTNKLNVTARYVRVRASGGDGQYAVGEVQVYSELPAPFPPNIERVLGYPLDQNLRSKALLFGMSLLIWLLVTFRKAPIWWVLLTAAWPAFAGFQLYSALAEAWPPGAREVSLIRGVVATVALGAILREVFAPKKYLARRSVVFTCLGVSAVTAFLAFYNLGQPQFYNQKEGSPTFVHYWDLRQYYTTAKYFPEIGYRGIYEADVAAYVEDTPGKDLENMTSQPMRDLGNLRMSTVGRERADIEAVQARFSPERWEEYKRDTAYLREAMGTRAYLETMHDMGGNATPFWMSLTHLLFNVVDPSEPAFLYTGLLDPLLLILAFLAVGLTFGARTALVCVVIFGANDFIMYGTNWGGATLRHDWMAYLALGACALKRERWALGGAFFAVATMIRAFPLVAIAGAALPAAWWIVDQRRATGDFPSWKTIREKHRPTIRLLMGALCTGLGLFVLSIIVLPVEAWFDWLKKVGELSGDPHANHISTRQLVAGWEGDQWRVLAARAPVFWAAVAFFVVVVVAAARGRPMYQGAVLTLPWIPVFFYPANYYIHFVWLLPLLLEERKSRDEPLRLADALLVTALLGMCAVQYFTVLVPGRGLHFYTASVVLHIALTLVLTISLKRDALNAMWAFVREGGWQPALAGVGGAGSMPAGASAEAGKPRATDEADGSDRDSDASPPASEQPDASQSDEADSGDASGPASEKPEAPQSDEEDSDDEKAG